MIIEIDQRGKIEDTGKDTIIAFSNGKSRSILIEAGEKREIQKIFRQIGKPRVFVLRSFAVLIFLLIKDYLDGIDEIIIDEEYPGQNDIIKSYLLQEIRKIYPDFSKRDISFDRVGKKSGAHLLAYGVATRKKRADIIISARQVLKLIVK